MGVKISPSIVKKLADKHGVQPEEIDECFSNVTDGGFLIDDRADHQSDPPTHWFIAETNKGRELEVCFMHIDKDIHIKTAFEPNAAQKRVYIKKTRRK